MILICDAIARLRELPQGAAQCCVTSPPYWGLRSYVATAQCKTEAEANEWADDTASEWTAAHGTPTGRYEPRAPVFDEDTGIWTGNVAGVQRWADGSWGEYGLESTPELFIAHSVEVFREVRRVLRDDGTLWLNIGDCYATGAGKVGNCPGGGVQGDTWTGPRTQPNRMPQEGLKPKDLVGIPWMLAFALRADGWWLRQDIIWHKPNPMPESVTDRCTKAHEYMFLLTKRERYYYDAEAIKERSESTGGASFGKVDREDEAHLGGAQARRYERPDYRLIGRNARDVWTIATEPFSEAHFATMPSELARRCIKAGTSERGACAVCGAPMERMTEKRDTGRTQKMPDGMATYAGAHGSIHKEGREKGTAGNPVTIAVTIGWTTTCECAAGVVPCVVLDPFFGAGTTGLAASQLGRQYIGVELNPEYAAMAEKRIAREMRPGTFVDMDADAIDGLFSALSAHSALQSDSAFSAGSAVESVSGAQGPARAEKNS